MPYTSPYKYNMYELKKYKGYKFTRTIQKHTYKNSKDYLNSEYEMGSKQNSWKASENVRKNTVGILK